MKIVLSKIRRYINKVLGMFPSQLPAGVDAYHKWADSIFDTYDLPTDNRDSNLFSLGMIITQLDTKKPLKSVYKPKYYFALMLQLGAATQIASYIAYTVREKRKAQEQQEATAKKSELSVVPHPTP